MSTRLQALFRLAAQSDAQSAPDGAGWITRCLHCRSKVGIDALGKPWPGTTLEHVVPRAWFGKRAAASLCADLDGPDDPRNLALACARCNHSKGRGPDAKGPADARAFQVVEQLRAARMARWRAPPIVAAVPDSS